MFNPQLNSLELCCSQLCSLPKQTAPLERIRFPRKFHSLQMHHEQVRWLATASCRYLLYVFGDQTTRFTLECGMSYGHFISISNLNYMSYMIFDVNRCFFINCDYLSVHLLPNHNLLQAYGRFFVVITIFFFFTSNLWCINHILSSILIYD